jgi:hypothetical protein
MQKDSRVVLGYHGTRLSRAYTIVSTGKFTPSSNDYDWLGHGIYFWEHAPARAWQWARGKYGSEGVVVEAKVRLGFCLDLTDIGFTDALRVAYQGIREAYITTGKLLPANRGKARCLDCLVINYLAAYILPECDTVRAPFLEGDPIFSGSNLLSQSHLQLVVRHESCIEPGIRLLPKEDR